MNPFRGLFLTFAVVAPLAACGADPSGTPADTTPDTTPGTPLGAPPESPELRLNAVLTGREVVPAVYDTPATGAATLTLYEGNGALGYTIDHTVEAPTAVHLHLGLAGESGEVMLPLDAAPGHIAGAVALTPEQARALRDGRAYLDIHSEAHPDGELRAQVTLPGELVYVARLTGDQLNPPVTTGGAGLAQALVDGTTRRMRFALRTSGMAGSPTSAEVRVAPGGADGPAVLDLTDPKTPAAVLLEGARTVASTEDLDAGRWYVNVGSARQPTGELRGQLLRPGETMYVARLSGDGDAAMNPVNTSAFGSLSVIAGVDLDRVRYEGVVADLAPTTLTLADGRGEVLLRTRPSDRSFRGQSMLTPESRMLGLLAGSAVHVSVGSAGFPEGEVRGILRPVGVAN